MKELELSALLATVNEELEISIEKHTPDFSLADFSLAYLCCARSP